MDARRLFPFSSFRLCVVLFVSALFVGAAPPALALANRVFVSQRSGNDANSCDNILTPCRTFAGAVLQLNPAGEAIVLDSGGYGPVTITQSLTIETPAGVTAFIHPASGNAVTVNAPTAIVTLRGLVLNGGPSYGVEVQAVAVLNIENCSISEFTAAGIHMAVGGHLNVKHTEVESCEVGVFVNSLGGSAAVTVDHCHLDGNTYGFLSQTFAPYGSSTTVTNSTANHNLLDGWRSGNSASGRDTLFLEFCGAAENGRDGIAAPSTVGSSLVIFSNCIILDNLGCDVDNNGVGLVKSRQNNTVGQTCGSITTWPVI